MKSRPILFSAPMVRALLAGTKTQTRRIMNPQPRSNFLGMEGAWWDHKGRAYPVDNRESAKRKLAGVCPYGEPGDTLWVRETWAWPGEESVLYRASHQHIQDKFRSDPNYPQFVWRPSIFMPRKFSRLTLEVTSARAERLQDISEEDAKAEGALIGYPPGVAPGRHRLGFRSLWESINGPGSWAANPWVWVLSFLRIDAQLEAAS